MFGRHYFPHRDWARRYDREYQEWMVRQIQMGRSFEFTPVTQAEKDAIYTSILPDYRAWDNNHRLMQLQTEEQQAHIWKSIPELNIRDLPEKDFGRVKLKPFKLEYDTLQEVSMRFRQTAIQIKGHPFYVSDVRKVKKQYYFLLENSRDQKFQVCLDEIDTFRGVPPGYVTLEGQHGYLSRIPARVNQQGMTTQNTSISQISTGSGFAFNVKGIVQAIESKGKTLPWNPHYRNLMINRVIPEMRLSDEVAVFTKKGQDPIYVGYHGRVFGKMNEDQRVSALDEDDLIQPWITKHFQTVNLEAVK